MLRRPKTGKAPLRLLGQFVRVVPVYDYIWSWLNAVDFDGSHERVKGERAGRHLSFLQGASEYTLGNIPNGWADLGLRSTQFDYSIKIYLFTNAAM